MSSGRKKPKEGKTPVPAYIVTFSDMTTLLLTFFVLLLTLAIAQDKALFRKGRDAFWESVRYSGMGALLGRKPAPYLGSVKIKYHISTEDKSFDGRTIDAKQEDIYRIFEKLSTSMTTMRSQIVADTTKFSVTDIRFPKDDTILNDSAKQFLVKFCSDLRQAPDQKAVKICVLGLAGEQKSQKKQWIVSARRAQAVAEFLKNTLWAGQNQYAQSGASLKWPIYSWGAGPGGNWVTKNSPISSQSQILIAVLRAEN